MGNNFSAQRKQAGYETQEALVRALGLKTQAHIREVAKLLLCNFNGDKKAILQIIHKLDI